MKVFILYEEWYPVLIPREANQNDNTALDIPEELYNLHQRVFKEFNEIQEKLSSLWFNRKVK